MAKYSVLILIAIFANISALPQRNRPFPTTRKPEPTDTTTPAAVSSTTWKNEPYPAAGFRPGRNFDLPTEPKSATEPASNYGPPASPSPSYGPPKIDIRTPKPVTTTSPPSYDPTARDARAQTPAPAPSYWPPTREPRKYTPPPTADPLPTYLPPTNKYGPPEDTPTTTSEPELFEPTTQRSPMPRNLGNGFYFIQLPSGWISRSGLLAVDSFEANATETASPELADVETIEPVSTTSESANRVPVAASAPVSPFVPARPVPPVLPTFQIQPVLQTQQRSVQVWPPRQPEKLVALQQNTLARNVQYVQPEYIIDSPQYVQPAIQADTVVEAAQPLYYVQPEIYSYTSEYRSW